MLNREIAVELLKVTDCQLDISVNRKEPLDIFLASPAGYYNFILMDIQMPVMDGYEAVKRLHASTHPNVKRVTVIAMTANAFKEDVERALAVGMNAHVAKPIDVKALYQTLEAAMQEV